MGLITRRSLALAFQVILMAAGVLTAVASSYVFAVRLNHRNPLYVARYRAARWMAENLPGDAVCASWNAGQIGYFSDRTVINLDGLINGVDYYNRVIRGEVSRMDYIYENGVSYLVDYKLEQRVPHKFSLLLEVPIRDGRGEAIQIWQVSAPSPSSGEE